MEAGRGPRARCRRLIASIVTVGLIASACTGEATPSTADAAPAFGFGRSATLAELTGPWRPQPLAVGAAIAAKADRACRSDPEFPTGVALVAIDARGGGKLLAQYAGGTKAADCMYLEIDVSGVVQGSLSGWGDSIEAPAPGRIAGAGQTGVGGGFGRGGGPPDPSAWSAVIGRAGAGIAVVVIDVPGRGRVQATLRDGWYLAWWPGQCCAKPLTVLAYDGSGTLLDQVTQ